MLRGAERRVRHQSDYGIQTGLTSCLLDVLFVFLFFFVLLIVILFFVIFVIPAGIASAFPSKRGRFQRD